MNQGTQISTSSLRAFTSPYKTLLKDRRLQEGLDACVWGIIGSGGCKVAQMAACNPLTAGVKHGERRLRRLIHGGNERAQVTAQALGRVLTSEGAKRLAGEHEVLLLIDESDLRKPFARELEYLDTVRDLEGNPVSGFHTLTVLGIGETGRRALLYQHSFSTRAPGFCSVNHEYRAAMTGVSEALRAERVGRLVWVMDRGFDDHKLLGWLHGRGECFVVRSQHPKRRARLRVDAPAKPLASWLADVAAVGRLPLEKRLLSHTSSRACCRVAVRALRVELEQLPGCDTTVIELSHPRLVQPWLLLSNLRVGDERAAQLALAERMVRAYRQRWAIEDLFSWTKDALDWESVRIRDYEALRTLVTLAWLAAAFIFDLGATPEHPEVLLLATLGRWTPGKARPGKAALCKGLARVLHHWVLERLAKNPATAALLRRLTCDLLRS